MEQALLCAAKALPKLLLAVRRLCGAQRHALARAPSQQHPRATAHAALVRSIQDADPRGVLNLEQCELVAQDAAPGSSTGFALRSADRTHYIECCYEFERDAWLQALAVNIGLAQLEKKARRHLPSIVKVQALMRSKLTRLRLIRGTRTHAEANTIVC